MIYDKDSIQPVVPEVAPETIALDPAGRVSYKCLDWVLSQSGFSIDQSLAGTDVPGSGEKLMESCFSWLEGK